MSFFQLLLNRARLKDVMQQMIEVGLWLEKDVKKIKIEEKTENVYLQFIFIKLLLNLKKIVHGYATT